VTEYASPPPAPMIESPKMSAVPTFMVRPALGRVPRGGFRMGDVVSEADRQTILNVLDPAQASYLSAKAWVAGHDIQAEFGRSASDFEQLVAKADALHNQAFDVEVTLRSSNPDDWDVSTDQIQAIQSLAQTDEAMWQMINQATVAKGEPPITGNIVIPGVTTTPGTIITGNPSGAPTASGTEAGSSWGLPDLLKLLPAGVSVFAPFLNKGTGTLTPRGVATVPVSSGMPWWGWGLIGLGGAGLVTLFIRKLF
jgi:hypothetical protein